MHFKKSILLLISVMFFVGCISITSRTHPIVEASEFKGPPLNGNVLVRFEPFPDTEYTFYIKSNLIEAVRDTKLFNDIQYREISSDLHFKGPVLITDDELFNLIFEAMPKSLPAKVDYIVDFVVLLKAADTNFYSEVWKILTLLIVPAKRHFSYKVGVRLLRADNTAIKNIVLSEDYRYDLSSIPYHKNSHAQITWEKEPIVNLMKEALKQFQSEGLLR